MTPRFMKHVLMLVVLVGLAASCDVREKERLKTEVDSLRNELGISRQMMATLDDVGRMMDSIDLTRDVLRANMLEGTTYDAYESRMKEIHSYIKDSKKRIEELERSLKSSKASAGSYTSALRKLKAELSARNQEYEALQAKVEIIRKENQELTQTVEEQQTTIEENLKRIAEGEEMVADLESQINKMLIDSKISEGEAYFMRAQALETAADRTKFAPRKKKATQREALELYKLAVSFGKKEAESKVEELEKEVG